MNLKFCRVLETSFNMFEMLKLLHSVYIVAIVTPQRRGVLQGKSLDFSRKIPIFKSLPSSQSSRQHYETFLENSPIITHFIKYNFLWVGNPDVREGQVEKLDQNRKKLSFFQENQG